MNWVDVERGECNELEFRFNELCTCCGFDN
jgi:hypothetical protein